jgi:hypothetical protein
MERGIPEQFGDDLQSAEAEVNSTNPNGVADALNSDPANAIRYLDEVANVLRSRGLEATTNVQNGNNNFNRGDLIAIWQGNDTFAERYDAVFSVGATDPSEIRPMRDAAQAGYTGHIPVAECVNQQ